MKSHCRICPDTMLVGRELQCFWDRHVIKDAWNEGCDRDCGTAEPI